MIVNPYRHVMTKSAKSTRTSDFVKAKIFRIILEFSAVHQKGSKLDTFDLSGVNGIQLTLSSEYALGLDLKLSEVGH